MNKLKIIYEDNHIIVVEKLPNIPSQSDKNRRYGYANTCKGVYKGKI